MNRRLEHPALHVVLYQPEIPSNTGNIARLCAAAQLRLHLIHPLGFKLDDRQLKRAGLDYWPEVDVEEHQDFEGFLHKMGQIHRLVAISRHAPEPYTHAPPQEGDCLLFGQETKGLPLHIRETFPCYAIPMWGRVRSLNLSTSVGIVAYHWLHSMGRF